MLALLKKIRSAEMGGALETGQAVAEWVAIAALVAALLVPGALGIWAASQDLYSSLDKNEDVTNARPHVEDTVNIGFRWVCKYDGYIDVSLIRSFGSDYDGSYKPGDLINVPPVPATKQDPYNPGATLTFRGWIEAGNWDAATYIPTAELPATAGDRTITYVAVYE